MSKRRGTRGTQIAALEAQRNEAQVRAEGAMLGERRAALARLVMVAVFGIVVNSTQAERHTAQFVVGASYTLFAIATLIVLYRLKGGAPAKAYIAPIVMTLVDFTFTTTMALFEIARGVELSPGRHAISSAILMSFAVTRNSPWHVVYSTVLAMISLAIVTGYAGVQFSQNTLFVMTGLAVLGFMIGVTNHAVSTMFQGLRQRDNLTRFLPRQVADRVMQVGPAALVPVEREITVMFSDIRGFTAMSETLSPTELLAMLDDYFGRMSAIVKGHDGVVGKFLGDGLLAFWGVPDRLDDHALRAVRAARDMRRALRELNDHRATTGLPPIKVGIGIHTGTVAAGMLGGELQSEYTVIGDAVNVASRVEGLTKEHAVDVLVSETTWAQLPEPRRGDRLASVAIRGRVAPIVLYTIDASAATVEITSG